MHSYFKITKRNKNKNKRYSINFLFVSTQLIIQIKLRDGQK